MTALRNLKSDLSVISVFTYSYDTIGNRTGVQEANGDLVTWSYDNTYQLTREQRSGANAYDTTYTYDPVGNRLTKVEGGATTTYCYDQANQIQTEETPTQVTTFTFDANGNTQVENAGGNLTTYSWTVDDMCVGIALPNGTLNTFAYDADLRRNQAQDSAGLAKFINDPDNVLLEMDSGGATQVAYTLEPQTYGNLIAQRRAGATSWHLYDALGSTDRLTDSNQADLASYINTAFGVPKAATGNHPNRLRWIGRLGYRLEADAEQYDVRRRRLSPTRGAWLCPDALRQGVDVRAYAMNSPISRTDPSGLMCILSSGDCRRYLEYAGWADRWSGYRPDGPLCGGKRIGDPNFREEYNRKVRYLYYRIVDVVADGGYTHAAAALRHFLSGTGRPLRLDWGWVESHESVRRAKLRLCEIICGRLNTGANRVNVSHWVNPSPFRERDLYGTVGIFQIRALARRVGLGALLCIRNEWAVRINWSMADHYDWHPGNKIPFKVCGHEIPDDWAFCLPLTGGGREFWHLSEYRARICVPCSIDTREWVDPCKRRCYRS